MFLQSLFVSLCFSLCCCEDAAAEEEVRAIITRPLILWPLGASGFFEVPVERPAAGSFPRGAWESVIAWAMQHIEQGSNVRFRPADITRDLNRLRIESGTDGCLSIVGRHPQLQPQRIALQAPHCLHRHAALHELLHALGLPHEHQRPDAPAHVRLSPQAPDWFLPHAVPDRASAAPAVAAALKPYDTASVMHYNEWLQAVNGSLQPIVDARAATLSSCDWHLLNTLYPGPMPAVACSPHAHPRACEPLPQCPFGRLVCDYICNLDCDVGRNPPSPLPALCGYIGGGAFPPLPIELQAARKRLGEATRVQEI